MNHGERLAVLLHLGTAAVTMLMYTALRPPAPPRLAGRRGIIAWMGRWTLWVLAPLLAAARAVRLSANGMTTIGAALSIAAGAVTGLGLWGWAAVLLIWGSASDLLDGELARTTGTQTKAGAFLDSSLDRISEIALFSGLAVSFPDRAGLFWAFAALAASFMVSYARARGEGLGVDCPPFGLERPQRVVPFLFAMCFTPFLSRANATLLLEGLCVYVAIGAGATALGRMIVIHQLLRREPRDAGSGHAGPQAPSR